MKKESSILKYIAVFLLITSSLFATLELNSATADELLELNGIGKVKSQKIIDYREKNHCFKSIDELAEVDGVTQNILSNNRAALTLGVCSDILEDEKSSLSALIEVLLDPVNLMFVFIILILGFLDQKTGKELKSQIVSVGVLGTFVGIFIGLQGFDPKDIINSVNEILVGLKTAFFTSIVGMSVATTLSVIQKFTRESKSEE